MKKFSIWHWVILALIITFTTLLAIGLILAVCQKGAGSGEAASWMQAIGSIGAIAVAIMLSRNAVSEKSTQAETNASVFIVQLLACLAELREACDRQNLERFAELKNRLNELVVFGRNLPIDALNDSQIWKVFECRSIAAHAADFAKNKLNTPHIHFGHARAEFERLRGDVHKASIANQG